MDGIHDLGGRMGFGPVAPEPDQPVFHAPWEARVFGLMRALGAVGTTGNTDRFRHAIERIDPLAYLRDGYYGRWLAGLETLCIEAGVVSAPELAARLRAAGAAPPEPPPARPRPRPDRVPAPTDLPGAHRPGAAAPRFVAGDPVRTTATPVPGHTRLPAYARGRTGTIRACHGPWVFPDSHAHGRGERPVPLYTVAFDGAELWGAAGEAGLVVHLDLFEPYLHALPGAPP